MFEAWEVEPGASATGHGRSIIEGLGESFLVIIMTGVPDPEKGRGDRSFFGPPDLVAQASDAMWSSTPRTNSQ